MDMSLQGHYAGFVSRLLAFLIDVVLLTVVLGAALSAGLSLVTTVNTLLGLNYFFTTVLGFSSVSVEEVRAGVGSLLSAVAVVGYPLLFWVLTGQTPGKMVLGLRVVTLDGGRVSLGRAILRLVGYVLAALPLYAGFAWIIVDNRRQGLHDKIAGTCVVYTWAARPDETFLRDLMEG